MKLAEFIFSNNDNQIYCDAFNFGPRIESNKSVKLLLEETFKYWHGTWEQDQYFERFHESNYLYLQIDKSYKTLGWDPKWDFNKTIKKTIIWYKNTIKNLKSPENACMDDIYDFMSNQQTI